MTVYTARASSSRQDVFCSFKSQAFIPGTHLKVGCMGSVFYWHSSYKGNIRHFSRSQIKVLRFYNLQTCQYTGCALPAPIISTFVVHTAEEALHGNICSLILSCVLGFKTVLEERSIGVTMFKYSAVFILKLLINIPNAVGSDFLSSAQNCIL